MSLHGVAWEERAGKASRLLTGTWEGRRWGVFVAMDREGLVWWTAIRRWPESWSHGQARRAVLRAIRALKVQLREELEKEE